MKAKIHLNPLAQEFLFGYIEGVDWVTDYTDDNNNLLTEQQQNEFYAKIIEWVNSYKKANNKKYSVIEIKNDATFNFIQCQAFAQADLIRNEVLKVSNDSASLFEDYFCKKTNKQKTRVSKNKQKEYKNYVQAVKQLEKLSDSRVVGYGGMIGEGTLALVSTICAVAGISLVANAAVHTTTARSLYFKTTSSSGNPTAGKYKPLLFIFRTA